jgi:hypothetical protein
MVIREKLFVVYGSTLTLSTGELGKPRKYINHQSRSSGFKRRGSSATQDLLFPLILITF